MSTVLGVVVLGAGDMGARHAQHWQAAGARLIAVCDPDVTRAEAIAAPFDAVGAASFEPYLLRDDVHVVSVCTPTFLHARFTVQALEAGKHVLCEKPAALALEDAEGMKEAAARHGCQLRIGFMRRFDPAYHQLMAFRERIGSPVLAQATVAAGVRPKLLMHDALANGGPIIDMCCHIFNVWSTFFGSEAETVLAQGYTFSQNKPELAVIEHKALDSALILLEYPGGSVGTVQVSWGLPKGIEAVERHTYIGPDGIITVNDWPMQMTLHDAGGETRWARGSFDPWRAEIAQFYSELTADAERRVASIDDGIHALKASLAVLKSVEWRHPIRISDLTPEVKPEPIPG